MYLPTSSARMILVSLDGWVDIAWRTALLEQPLLLSSSTAWMLATSGLVEVLKNITMQTPHGHSHIFDKLQGERQVNNFSTGLTFSCRVLKK